MFRAQAQQCSRPVSRAVRWLLGVCFEGCIFLAAAESPKDYHVGLIPVVLASLLLPVLVQTWVQQWTVWYGALCGDKQGVAQHHMDADGWAVALLV